MRIVQLLPELNEGGVERGTVELSRELVRRGEESIVISAGGRLVNQIEVDGGAHVTLDVSSKNPLTVPARILSVRKALRELQPDIIHARSRVPAWLAYVANRGRKPFVTTVHGFNSVNPYSRVMTFGDRVICVSGAIREYVQKNYGVSEDKLVVIPRGIDLELFNPRNVTAEFITNFKRTYQLEGKFVVTSVGRITQLKDYETFIAALTKVKQTIPQLVGLIVGGVHPDRQAYFERLKEQVKAAGSEDYIHFTGSQEKVPELYALSDVVVSSSKKPESFGRAAAEALAMNVPVVATGHGGVLDIVKEGKTGFLFSPEDGEGLKKGILQIYQQPMLELRTFVAERFSLGQMVDGYLNVYHSLFQGK